MPKISAWGAGILKHLTDGHWHTRKEVIDACRVLVPPDYAITNRTRRVAWYRAWRDRKQRPLGYERPIGRDEQAIIGSRNIVACVIISMVRSGTLLKRGSLATQEIKLSDKGLMRYAYMLKGKILGSGGVKPSPHCLAMLKYLLHGGDKWHAQRLVIAAGARLIPPAKAVRVRDHDQQRLNPGGVEVRKRTLAQKIAVGSHAMCWTGLKGLIKHGMIERRNDDDAVWLRITAKGRIKYGPVAQSDERRDPNAEAGGSSPPGPATAIKIVPPNREASVAEAALRAMRHDDEEPGKLMARKHAVVMVCRVCGLRAKGVMDRWGRLRLSDRVRPKPGAEPVVGLCEGCEEKQMAEINEEVRQHREQSK